MIQIFEFDFLRFLELHLSCCYMSTFMELRQSFEDTFGYSYVEPLSKSIRIFLEGEDAEICIHNPAIRWIVPKEWHIDAYQFLIFFMISFSISILAPLANRFVFFVCFSHFFSIWLFLDLVHF